MLFSHIWEWRKKRSFSSSWMIQSSLRQSWVNRGPIKFQSKFLKPRSFLHTHTKTEDVFEAVNLPEQTGLWLKLKTSLLAWKGFPVSYWALQREFGTGLSNHVIYIYAGTLLKVITPRWQTWTRTVPGNGELRSPWAWTCCLWGPRAN